MHYISDVDLDKWIAEDLPYFDLTCHVAGIADTPAQMNYFSRQEGIACGGGEVARIAQKLGLTPVLVPKDGQELVPYETFCTLEGTAEQLHAAWKICLNVFDHASGIATATRKLVDTAHAVNPNLEVLTTRKGMPGAKGLQVAGIIAGGAFPHRLGLSETVLFFEQHMVFLGGFEKFLEQVPEMKHKLAEKKLFVECSLNNAEAALAAGVDGIQFDKAPADEIAATVSRLKQACPSATFVAAGGINISNVAEYAATGVDGLVTTWPLTVKPLDMSVKMVKI